MSCHVDHLVVAADSLEQGADWCREHLGVVPGPGGKHALMGTHNRLASIASNEYELAYLEILAIDPEAPPPPRPRWFGLDEPALRAAVQTEPRLLHLVARTSELDDRRAALLAGGIDPGEALAAERTTATGTLRWRILVRADGAIAAGGVLPTLIEWQGKHPGGQMSASPLRLRSVQIGGLVPAAAQALQLHRVDLIDSVAPHLSVTIESPRGLVLLRSWR